MAASSNLTNYYRLAKPGIVYSNVMTAAAGYLFAADGHPKINILLELLVGLSLVIAAACVLNNYLDRGIDSKMARTKNRTLVKGDVTNSRALAFAAGLLITGLVTLGFTNLITFLIALAAVFCYVLVYGYAKRRTIFSTLVGTAPGAASLVAGYTASANQLDSSALVLFLIMLTWQMAHFYSISIFRYADYKAAGLPVWSVKKGIKSTKNQIVLFIIAYILTTIGLTLFGNAGYTYLTVMLFAGFYWLRKGLAVGADDAKWARKMFGTSLIVLMIFCISVSVNSFTP